MASVIAGTDSVAVTWTAPGGLAPDGYHVTRITQPDGTTEPACGSAVVPLVTASCTDESVPAGTYNYTVTAVFRSWTATSIPSNTVTISTDGIAPVVTVTQVNGAARSFPYLTNEPPASVGGECGASPGDAPTVNVLIDGAPASPATATCTDGLWSLTLGSPVSGEGDVTFSATQTDNAGNLGTSPSRTVTIDTTAPTVTGVSSPLANGSYRDGQVVPVTVTFSEPVLITGSPTLTLATGSAAGTPVDYTSGSETNVVTFSYTVEPGHTSADLDYFATDALGLNGGVVADAATNNASLTLATPGAAGSLGSAKDLVIDTTAPLVAVTRVNGTTASFPYATSANVTSIGGTCGTATGDPATVQVLVDGAAAGSVPCTSGSWTLGTSWTTEGTRSVSATQLDAAGNTGTAPSQAISIDVTRPRVIEVTSTLPNGIYRVGDQIPVTVIFDEPVVVTGTPTLILTTRPKATTSVAYTSGSGTDTLTFTYTVAAGDSSADLDYNKRNSLSGTLLDAAGNIANRTLPRPGGTGSLSDTKDLVIDTTVPLAAAVAATPTPTPEPTMPTGVTESASPASVSEPEGHTSVAPSVAS
jgi:hypothetical protein